ncbi:hypothetical protein AMTRI_Chr01g103870 [Amborella trichopoda]|uniref:tRNA dimethylallyltransferase 2 n=1 Tax=Amborella trichopoda TaxID=13333 RepID=W1NRJ9_AMBTC|nr:tRNA dimethylallyltransferase 2 [Amborella trichopoda]ERM98158.1 hypothetical protein AMTR_s00095p00098050 [Amborella trichopoda]|eukprot:XP_006832880.1 tRNA dimethylallyltransferase 2 [Amborella trichopoda]
MDEHVAYSLINPNPKPKIVVVLGATGAGKSKLAIDLASHFSAEIVNADSMQVYEGLDVLTNKVTYEERKGIPHHLLGIIGANRDFTSKDFRDMAIPIIEGIWSRNGLPIVVGGTNYYIQALVTPFLHDDMIESMDECMIESVDECFHNEPLGEVRPDVTCDSSHDHVNHGYDRLKEIDPDAAKRIHPNDQRKINHYLHLYGTTGIPPSKLFQGKGSEKWGRSDNFRFDCCFLWVDASLCVLDTFVEQRVESMINDGLLNEVCEIYQPNADYTRGLRQAIGVREFEEFFRSYHPTQQSCMETNDIPNPDIRALINSVESNDKVLLCGAIDKMKANTRRLVRRQKRRLNRLMAYFGWNIHYFDATDFFICKSSESWLKLVVEPCVDTIKSFLSDEATVGIQSEKISNLASRDLWTQYICEYCGFRVLRGAHEWEQHRQGRGHRRRVARLKRASQTVNMQTQLPDDSSC